MPKWGQYVASTLSNMGLDSSKRWNTIIIHGFKKMLNVGPGSWSKIKIFGGPWVLSVIEGPKSALRQKYIEHNKRVQEIIPKEDLLIWNVKDGWEPLCSFLGHDVPETPLGNFNRTTDGNWILNYCKKRLSRVQYFKFMGPMIIQSVISLAIAYLTPIVVAIVLVNKFM